MIVCQQCGYQNDDDDQFCGGCPGYLPHVGLLVEDEEDAEPVDEVVEPQIEEPGFVQRVVSKVRGEDLPDEPDGDPPVAGVDSADQDGEAERAAQAEAQRAAQAAEAEAERARVAQAERARKAAVEEERARVAQAEAERARAAQIEAERVRAAQVEAERVRAARVEEERVRAAHAEAEQVHDQAERARTEAAEALRAGEAAEAERAREAAAEAQRAREAAAEAERAAQAEAEAQRAREAAAEAERARAEEAERVRVAEEAAERARRAAAMVAKAPPPEPAPPPARAPRRPTRAAAVTTPAVGQGEPAVSARQPAAQQPAPPQRRPAPTRKTPPSRVIEPGDLICGRCGEPNKPERRFCRRCAEPLDEAEVARTPWWRRLFRRKPKVVAAGERPGRPGSSAKSKKGQAKKLVRRVKWWVRSAAVVAALLVGVGVLGPWRGPVQERVDGIYQSVRNRVAPELVTAPIESTTASSELPDNPGRFATDGADNRHWTAAEPGEGPFLVVRFTEPVDLRRVGFLSGASGDAFLSFPRPREVHLVYDSGGSDDIELLDQAEFQDYPVSATGVQEVQVHVRSLHPSTEANNQVSITNIQFSRVR